MKKQDLIFLGITVLLLVMAFILVLVDKITYEQYLMAGGGIILLVNNIRQGIINNQKDGRIEILENDKRILAEIYQLKNE